MAQDVVFDVNNENIHCAIITDDIDGPNKLTKEDIALLSRRGFTIDSHGASHAALAIFIDEILQPSLVGGTYANTPYGKERALSTQEIKYQLIESSKDPSSITRCPPTSFVLPYGLYNQEVIYRVAQTEYQRVYTCDAALDGGQFLTPRPLITQDNIEHIEKLIRALSSWPRSLV